MRICDFTIEFCKRLMNCFLIGLAMSVVLLILVLLLVCLAKFIKNKIIVHKYEEAKGMLVLLKDTYDELYRNIDKYYKESVVILAQMNLVLNFARIVKNYYTKLNNVKVQKMLYNYMIQKNEEMIELLEITEEENFYVRDKKVNIFTKTKIKLLRSRFRFVSPSFYDLILKNGVFRFKGDYAIIGLLCYDDSAGSYNQKLLFRYEEKVTNDELEARRKDYYCIKELNNKLQILCSEVEGLHKDKMDKIIN